MMSSEDLIERARAEAALSDFGPDGWREGLDQLVLAVARDVGSDAGTVAAIEGLITGRLVKRLKIEGWLANHAEPEPPPVEGPVVIVGLPRTATTALHYLLASDPAFRYLRAWELRDPVPPPDVRTEGADPRRVEGNRPADVRHIQAADGPVEDSPIHEMCFHHGELALPVPSYTAWWRDADHSSAFAYHERVLRLLHRDRPPCLWLLKMPTYLFQLGDLVTAYPSARIVMTHRDPTQAIPSTCSTLLDSRQRRVPDWVSDPLTMGAEVLAHFAAGMRRAIEARAMLGPGRFIDVGQREVESDPGSVAERIYDFLGLDLGPELRDSMVEWAGRNRRGSRGTHRYRSADYGLSEGAIRREFAEYLDEYGRYC